MVGVDEEEAFLDESQKNRFDFGLEDVGAEEETAFRKSQSDFGVEGHFDKIALNLKALDWCWIFLPPRLAGFLF